MSCMLKKGGGLYPRLHIGAVLLAAGEGRRMGGLSKPLIRLQGVPLICRTLVALSGAGVDEVVVVTGHAREAVEEQIRRFSVTLAVNDMPAQGIDGSERLGLEALSGRFDAILLVPADQPLLSADDITELIGAFKKRPRGHVVIPTVDGRRGNPVVIDEAAQDQILASGAHQGCGDLIKREPTAVHLHETANTRFITDLDTVGDVQALARRTGWRLDLPEAESIA